jgi:hypothetical protein
MFLFIYLFYYKIKILMKCSDILFASPSHLLSQITPVFMSLVLRQGEPHEMDEEGVEMY